MEHQKEMVQAGESDLIGCGILLVSERR